MINASDVIVAPAAGPGVSTRGVVRASGADAYVHLQDILRPPLAPTHAPAFVDFTRGVFACRLRLADDLDLPCLALIAPGPRSYTGEDTIELHVPGGPRVIARVVDRLLEPSAAGVAMRHAEAGEFTARAYFNGRLSLTEAEGVAATISATSDAELRAARLLSTGALADFAHALADDLAGALALVEAGVDFTDEEDVVPIDASELAARLADLIDRLERTLDRATGMERLHAIPWVVLSGPPNAGKSTLFNALLGHERAVVSPVAGATRDVLAEPLVIPTDDGPAEVMLVDLAGADDTPGGMNRRMQAARRAALQRAELRLDCTPADQMSGPADVDPAAVDVRTMIDRGDGTRPAGSVGVSAATGVGLDELRRAIADRLADRAVSLSADALGLQSRHDAALRSALGNLRSAADTLASSGDTRALTMPELIAASMRAALDDLADLAGEMTPDDVLGRVFASFCVGK